MSHSTPFKRSAHVLIAAVAAFALAPAAAGQEFTTIYLKRSTFVQTGNDTIQPFNDWLLTIDCSTIFSNIDTMRLNGQSMQHAPGSKIWKWNSTYFPSLAQLNAAYPDAAMITQEIIPSAGPTQLVQMWPGNSFMPNRPPRFLDGAYDALQNANPNSEIHLHTDGYTPAPNATATFTSLDVVDLNTGKVVFSVEAPSSTPQDFVIPPGTLLPDNAYYVLAGYRGENPYTFPLGGIGFMHFVPTGMYRTQLTFITRHCIADITGDGAIDLNDFFAFFNCWDASAPCADLDGNPGVDLGDFFAFFNAFDTNC